MPCVRGAGEADEVRALPDEVVLQQGLPEGALEAGPQAVLRPGESCSALCPRESSEVAAGIDCIMAQSDLARSFIAFRGNLTAPQTNCISMHSRRCSEDPPPHPACMEHVSTCLIPRQRDSAPGAEVTAPAVAMECCSGQHEHSLRVDVWGCGCRPLSRRHRRQRADIWLVVS